MTPKTLLVALCLVAMPLAAAGPEPLPHTHCEPAASEHHYALPLNGGVEVTGIGPLGLATGTTLDGALDDCNEDGVPADNDGENEFGVSRVHLSSAHHDSTICVADASGEPVAFSVVFAATKLTAGFSYGDCITVGADPNGWDVYPWHGVFHLADGTVHTSAATAGTVW